MKKVLKSFYQPSESEFTDLWNNCLFVFDANILLNLYRYSLETINEFFKMFKDISERLWLPYQAALEFHKNRRNVISTQLKVYDDLISCLKKNLNNIKSEVESNKRYACLNLTNILKKIEEEIEFAIKDIKHQKQNHPDYAATDIVLDNVTNLFKNRVGKKYNIKRQLEIYEMGKVRYEFKIPPGFADNLKGNDKKFGDLILWFHLIDKAKEINKPIILVTDDRKEDWWLKHEGKTVGPRPELIDEMYEESGVKFHIYQFDQFLENIREYLKKRIKVKAINEVKEIKMIDESILRASNVLNSIALANVEKMTAMSSAIDNINYQLTSRLLAPLEDIKKNYLTLTSPFEMALNYAKEFPDGGSMSLLGSNAFVTKKMEESPSSDNNKNNSDAIEHVKDK